jgi:SAM-dependent methyltransferase
MKKVKLKQLLYGMATFVPGVKYLRARAKGSGGTISARYCYSVWLRHLVMAKKNGLNPHPKIVAELGPGDSLGIGLAALISGCDKYFAFDLLEHANAERNARVFDELVALFRNRASIPGGDEFPDVHPFLEDYAFPADILDEKRLQYALEKSRIERIRDSLADFQRKGSFVQYKAPWNDAGVLESDSVDMIYSQAVLEHIDDLRGAYRAMHSWLKSTGYISHQIDFTCHGTADEWNGHWTYSDLFWKLIRGKQPYLINREPLSTHIAILTEEGFKVIGNKKVRSESRLTANELAPQFKSISDDDLITSGAFVQAVRTDLV